MSSHSQTTSKERPLSHLEYLTPIPSLYTFSWYVTIQTADISTIHHRRKGTKEQKVGGEDGVFSGTGEMESFCQLHSCFLSSIIICSSEHLNLLAPSAALIQLFSGGVLAAWGEENPF